MSSKNQAGFTLIELMIATAVFTVVLLVATTGIIKIGNIYYKGIITSQTQNTVRNLGNDIATSLQFASYNVETNPTPPPPLNQGFYCLGNTLYYYYLNSQYKKGSEFTTGLYSADLAVGSTCSSSSATVKCTVATTINCYNDRRQLLGDNMRVMVFAIKPVSGSSSVYSINLRIIYGDTELLTTAPTLDAVTCKSGVSGSSFCAVGQLDTVVEKRLK